MSTGPAPGYHTSEDEKTLHKLGYAQELFRAMGGFQNFAISFTIISILAGCLTSYVIAYGQGGPVAVTWGWLIVGLMSTLVALVDGRDRIRVSDRGRPLLLGVEAREPGLGLVHRAGSTSSARSQSRRRSATGSRSSRPRSSTTGSTTRTTRSTSTSRTPSSCSARCVLNLMKVTVTAMLNTISAYWHMIGVGVIVVVLLARPRRPPLVRLDLHGHGQRDGLGRRGATGFGASSSGTSSSPASSWPSTRSRASTRRRTSPRRRTTHRAPRPSACTCRSSRRSSSASSCSSP